MATTTQGSKSSKVRELLSLGAPASDIAKQVGCTLGLVYNVKARMSSGSAKRKPGRPANSAGTATVTTDLDTLVDTLRRSQEEHDQLRATMQRLATLISEVL